MAFDIQKEFEQWQQALAEAGLARDPSLSDTSCATWISEILTEPSEECKENEGHEQKVRGDTWASSSSTGRQQSTPGTAAVHPAAAPVPSKSSRRNKRKKKHFQYLREHQQAPVINLETHRRRIRRERKLLAGALSRAAPDAAAP